MSSCTTHTYVNDIVPSVAPSQPSITSSSTLPNGVQGSAYSFTFQAAGGVEPYAWSITNFGNPAGMLFDGDTGELSGTPEEFGTYSYTVSLTDAVNNEASLAVTWTVIESGAVTLEITTTVLPDGRVGSAYSQALSVAGGVAPYTWSISSSSLPAGLSLSSGGVISGTPTTAGNSSFTVQVEDDNTDTDTQGLTIEVLPEPSDSDLYPNAPTGAGWTDITPGTGSWETSPVGPWTVQFDTRDGWGLKFPNSTRTQSIEVVPETPIGETRTARFTYPINHFAGGGGELFIEGGSRFFGTRKVYMATWMRLSSNWWGHGSCVNKLYYMRPTTGGQWWVQFCAGGNGTLTPRFVNQIAGPAENYVATTSPTTWPRRGEFFLIEADLDLDTGIARLWTKRTDQASPVLHVEVGPADWPYENLAGTRWDSVVLSGILGGIGDTNNPEVQFMEFDNVKVMVSP